MEKVFAFIKKYRKPFLIIFLIYCFAMLAILRANISYIDDIGRANTGYGWASDFNRYSSSFLSFFLINMNLKLADLSPWTQILALMMVAATSMILVYLFSHKKVKILPLICSAFLGLAPFSIACLVYKFDAPCMAMALFVSVLPFLFWPGLLEPKKNKLKNWLLFGIVSWLGLMIMWTSYQAFCGVYIIVCLALLFRRIFDGEKIRIRQFLFCIIPYLLAGIVYKFVLPEQVGYRETEVFSLMNFIPGVISNIGVLIQNVEEMFALNWKIFLVLFLLALIISFKGIKNKLVAVVFVVLCFILSLGPFLALKELSVNPRALVGISVALAIFGIFLANNFLGRKNISEKRMNYLLLLPAFLLLYVFFIFPFAFGNSLADQKRYSDFRNEMVVSDLANLYPDHELVSRQRIQIQGTIGYSSVARHVATQYPITARLIVDGQEGLNEAVWGTKQQEFYYNHFYQNFPVYLGKIDCSEFETKADTYYHTIKASSDDLTICVILK